MAINNPPTTPAQTSAADKVRDLAVKAFWTAAAVSVPALVDLVTESDVPAGWYPVFAAAANVVLGWVRQQAGKYVPPPAETVQASTGRHLGR